MNQLPAHFKYKIADDPPVCSGLKEQHSALDYSIRLEGLKYTLREWRRWTRNVLIIDDISIERAQYVHTLVTTIVHEISSRGYMFIHNIPSLSGRLLHHWLNLYKSSNKYSILPNIDNKCHQEEYEEWNEHFPTPFWEDITEEYIVYGGFDDTDVGRNLLADLPAFFWLYVDPHNSEKIIKRREEKAKADKDINYNNYEESEKKISQSALAESSVIKEVKLSD